MQTHDTPDVGMPERLADDELASLAVAAGRSDPVGADAVSVWEFLGTEALGALPSWYMPAPMGMRRFRGWRRGVVRCTVFSVVASFVAINAYGLCNTYGQLHF
jgi:hypothetical protein